MPNITVWLSINHCTYNIQAENTWDILCYVKDYLLFNLPEHIAYVEFYGRNVKHDEKLIENEFYRVYIVRVKH